MVSEKQCQLEELTEELEIILSVKDGISSDEIFNLVNKFSLLSEYDIRKKIEEITDNHTYVQEFMDKVNEETSNIPIKNMKKVENEVINSEDIKDSDLNESEENLPIEEPTDDREDKEELELDTKKEEYIREENLELNKSEQEIEESKTTPSNEIIKDSETGAQKVEKIIFDKDNIPEVSFVKAEIKYGQLSLEWGWPEGVERVLLCYRMDMFPDKPTDSCAAQIIIRRENGFETGDYVIQNIIEGNYYFSIYTLAEVEEKKIFSSGQRRLVVNKAPSEIFYQIKMKKSLLGKLKAAELVFSRNSTEINLPQFVLVGRLGNMPLQKSDGEVVFNTEYQTLTKDTTISFNLPIEKVGKNMYVKLFFLDDSNSKVYRIISPAKEKLYFK